MCMMAAHLLPPSTAEGLLEQSLAVFEESYGSDSWECLGVRDKGGAGTSMPVLLSLIVHALHL